MQALQEFISQMQPYFWLIGIICVVGLVALISQIWWK
jgi:hypothetical protein